jgi:hypothetical protein
MDVILLKKLNKASSVLCLSDLIFDRKFVARSATAICCASEDHFVLFHTTADPNHRIQFGISVAILAVLKKLDTSAAKSLRAVAKSILADVL